MLSLIYDARKISGILPFCTNPAPVEHTECRAVDFSGGNVGGNA